jgi:hypothetical protein
MAFTHDPKNGAMSIEPFAMVEASKPEMTMAMGFMKFM